MATVRRRPGTRISWVGEVLPRILPGFADVVGIPFVHDWGPLGTDTGGKTLAPSMSAWQDVYGTSATAGSDAVGMAFRGEDTPGAARAGGVIPYRMAGAAAAKATVTVMNTAGTPAAALRLDAKYVGTKGNNLTYTIADDPTNAARDIITFFLGGARVESYTYLNADTAGLVTQINALSKWVAATALGGAGVALALAASPVAFAGGNDGATLTTQNWVDALNNLTFERFSVFAPYDTSDAAVIAAIKQWTLDHELAMRPVVSVVGGALGETVATALARQATLTDPHMVTIGVGTYFDQYLQHNVSTSQLAPRIAGILAGCGETRSLTFALLGNLSAVVGPQPDEITTMINNGIVAISRAVTSADADLEIEMGVTTFVNGTASRPAEVFGDPRLVRVMDIFLRGMKEWGDSVVIGRLPNNPDTRATVDKEGSRRVSDLLTRGLILPADPLLGIPDPFFRAQATTDDSIPFKFGWQFARTTNYIDGEGKVR